MQQESVSAQPKRSPLSFFSKPRVKGVSTALGGMVAGAIVGITLRTGLEATGMLGPSVGALIAEQESNFSELNSRLDALQGAASDPEVKRSLGELRQLLQRQDELAQQAAGELRFLGAQVSELKDKQLAESGMAGGADFWLKAGESINVGGRDQVFGLLGVGRGAVDVNLNGARKRLFTGDTIKVESADRACDIFYKQATPRADGRVGFDLNCG